MSPRALGAEMQTCQRVGTVSIGLDGPREAGSRRAKADMSYMTALATAGHSLMLRF